MKNRNRLIEKFEELEENLLQLESDPLVTDDIEDSNEDLHFSKYNSDQIHLLTNFYPEEFENLYNLLHNAFCMFRSNKGKKAALSEHDLLLLLLVYLKGYHNFNQIALDFSISTSTAKNYIDKMIEKFSPVLADNFINFFKKELHNTLDMRCGDFNEAATIIDCSVQQISRFAGSFRDNKIFFSAKHGIYCVKKEYTHLPNGMVCMVSNYYNGAKHDFAIFSERIDLHKNMLKKESDEGFWSIIEDKGYQGGEKLLPMILPKKGKNLQLNDIKLNKKIGIVRIICENYYGRMKKLWGAAREKVKGDLKNYDNLNLICVSLTNYHISLHPLRNNDMNFLRNLNSKNYNNKRKKDIDNLIVNSLSNDSSSLKK